MIQSGDVHIADLNDERRRRVLVVSNSRFHRLAGRALVAPEIPTPPDDLLPPWHLQVNDAVYAVDLLRSLPVARLLERTGRAPESMVAAARHALVNIT